MSVYAISDLHLSFGVDKPMNIFGKIWNKYEEKISQNWKDKVKKQDTVIIAGDISWGMHLSETKKDFEFLHNLPGKKIILKGNHDYYFQSKTKLENFFKYNDMEDICILQNDAFLVENYIVCGTRGWGEDVENKEIDSRLIKREALRLKMTLDKAKKIKENDCDKKILLVMHFPPFIKEFQDVIKEYEVHTCIYRTSSWIWT